MTYDDIDLISTWASVSGEKNVSEAWSRIKKELAEPTKRPNNSAIMVQYIEKLIRKMESQIEQNVDLIREATAALHQ